jgi:lipopolysaccharide biosynthesis glycosyltransferase
MIVRKIYVNTYKYDFHFAKICIASIRFWYPDIPIFLIKEYSAGDFDTSLVEKTWNVEVLDISRKKFGWGYGKLEPLFLENHDSFLVIDSDTVMTGPVLDVVKNIDALFVVDDEVQPVAIFNQIYYNLDRIRELEKDFVYPGYSFNSGQWFGTSGIISREDFSKALEWSEPPKPKFPDIVFNGDQAHLNFVLHWLEQTGKATVEKIRLMVWPEAGKGDFIELAHIIRKGGKYPYIIHWAGMKYRSYSDLPRADILAFYRDYYYSKNGRYQRILDVLKDFLIVQAKRTRLFSNRFGKLFGT